MFSYRQLIHSVGATSLMGVLLFLPSPSFATTHSGGGVDLLEAYNVFLQQDSSQNEREAFNALFETQAIEEQDKLITELFKNRLGHSKPNQLLKYLLEQHTEVAYRHRGAIITRFNNSLTPDPASILTHVPMFTLNTDVQLLTPLLLSDDWTTSDKEQLLNKIYSIAGKEADQLFLTLVNQGLLDLAQKMVDLGYNLGKAELTPEQLVCNNHTTTLLRRSQFLKLEALIQQLNPAFQAIATPHNLLTCLSEDSPQPGVLTLLLQAFQPGELSHPDTFTLQDKHHLITASKRLLDLSMKFSFPPPGGRKGDSHDIAQTLSYIGRSLPQLAKGLNPDSEFDVDIITMAASHTETMSDMVMEHIWPLVSEGKQLQALLSTALYAYSDAFRISIRLIADTGYTSSQANGLALGIRKALPTIKTKLEVLRHATIEALAVANLNCQLPEYNGIDEYELLLENQDYCRQTFPDKKPDYKTALKQARQCLSDRTTHTFCARMQDILGDKVVSTFLNRTKTSSKTSAQAIPDYSEL